MTKVKKSIYRVVVTGLLLSSFILVQGCSQKIKLDNAAITDAKVIEIKMNNSNVRDFRVGDKLDFNISVTKPLYLSCFYESKDGIQKFTPGYLFSGAENEKPVQPNNPIKIEGGHAGNPIGQDKISCIGSEQPVSKKLPRELSTARKFDKVYYVSIEEIHRVFNEVIGGKLYFKTVTLNIVGDVAGNPLIRF